MKWLAVFAFFFACLAPARASWYWPFGDDDEPEPKRLSELMEPASLLIDDASDLASEGKVQDAVEKYRAALKELDKVESENPDRAKKPEFATLRTKRAYINAAIDSMLLSQARQNARTVAVSDTTELERRYEREREMRNEKLEMRKERAGGEKKKAKAGGERRKVKRAVRARNESEAAMLAIERKDFAEADRIIAKLLEEKPNGAVPLNLRAMREMAGGDLKKAERTLDQAIQSNPRDYTAYYNMALVLLEANAENTGGAKRYYETGRAFGGPVDKDLEARFK